ncbi:hypothetical protein B0I35DRAFT_433421 [Stachybotrys elegans]|uniref:lipoyl(octanoyl) transferase n=1 Tax=Stachybotrys elegans TaxID=80388 RepID=A0A8K0SK24_9HYPO|nr:hypothetical protein B0I35DRAFT_433421 [Stachybotrys elegans]
MWTTSRPLLRLRHTRCPKPHSLLLQRHDSIDVLHRPRWSSGSAHLQLLQHRHVVGQGPGGIVDYGAVEAMQEELRAEFLAFKGMVPGPNAQPPRPHLLSFESMPTFTLGRRQEQLDAGQSSRLERELAVDLTRRRQPVRASLQPQVRKTNRGGLTTYHGPGQLVLWPILDMHSPLYPSFGVASYASHLETTTQRLLAQLFGIETFTTRDEPGVWVQTAPGEQMRKIAAMGVHHRRHVTALGIAVNIDVPVTGDEHVNPWARFVPCGLEGKAVTSVAAELGRDADGAWWNVADLATCWAKIFEEGLLDSSKR